MFEIRQADNGHVVVQGRLDAAQAPGAQGFLDGVQGKVVLDCAGLEYISSAGLGVLLKTQKRLVGAGGGLRLVAVNAHIMDIFRFSGFDQIFELEAQA